MSIAGRKRPVTVEQTTEPSSDCPLGLCDGSGEIKTIEREPEDTQKPIGEGYYIGPSTCYTSRLCDCRANLGPRAGEARWWSSKTIYSDEWESQVHQHAGEIVVCAEVPISEDNYIVEKRGNRYYPTFVDVDFESDWLHALFPDEARELAAKLIAAADACDAYDKPDCTPEGIWWFPE